MTDLNDLKSSFSRKLDQRQQEHQQRLKAELDELRQLLQQAVPPAQMADLSHQLQAQDHPRNASQNGSGQSSPHFPTLMDMGEMDPLRQLDLAFWDHFQLGRYFPAERLNYPTRYCETLEEFHRPEVELLDLSPQERTVRLREKIQETESFARQYAGGGVFGYNLSGRGCYLNGWLFAYGRQLSPRQALANRSLLPRILGTAAHEKLGHGFLDLYTALGEVKTRLGLSLVEIAGRFGLRQADDPLSSLRLGQHNLLFTASQLLEEGWATWVANYLDKLGLGGDHHIQHSPERIWAAIQNMPDALRKQVQEDLQASLVILFTEQDRPVQEIHAAIRLLEVLGGQLDDYFMQTIGQPLRYAVGELLFAQAVRNQGSLCAPYTAIIAANLTFDPAQISLNDLATLLAGDPRLNPDTRLACLSRLRLQETNSVTELARRAQAELSLSVPPELKD